LFDVALSELVVVIVSSGRSTKISEESKLTLLTEVVCVICDLIIEASPFLYEE
jgi:hypothetical protein